MAEIPFVPVSASGGKIKKIILRETANHEIVPVTLDTPVQMLLFEASWVSHYLFHGETNSGNPIVTLSADGKTITGRWTDYNNDILRTLDAIAFF